LSGFSQSVLHGNQQLNAVGTPAMPESKLVRIFVFTALGLLVAPLATSQTAVLTRSYDDARTGANMTETVFTPRLLQKGLHRVKRLIIDDDSRIEAQPLYVPNLKLSDGSRHNVLFVASMGNHVWAFDADATEGKDLLWKTALGVPYTPVAGVQINGQCVTDLVNVPDAQSKHRCAENDWWGVNIHWGILSTPVIDIDDGSMYVINWVMLASDKNPALYLHRIRLQDGKETAPARPLQGSLNGPDGVPLKDSNKNPVVLHPDQKVRAALLLVPLHGTHKTLFAATTGGENPGAPHGWVLAFDTDAYRQTAAWVSTPSSFGGGIWQGSQGPSADDEGNVYAMTGNGGYVTAAGGHMRDFEGDTDFAEAFVKLKYVRVAAGQGTLSLADWFIPFKDSDRESLSMYNYRDQDLGSAAPVVPPGTDVVLGAGKDGLLYILDRHNLGKTAGSMGVMKPSALSYVTYNGVGLPTSGGESGHDMDFPLGYPSKFPNKTHHLHGSPVYWDGPNGPTLFTWGENESLRAWKVDLSKRTVSFIGRGSELASAKLAANPTSMGGMTGGMLTLSSNGKLPQTGIVWATAPIDGDANHDVVEGIVRAYDATELDSTPFDSNTPRLKLLWDSDRAGVKFEFSKFCTPMVADGKLFVPTYDGRVDVYAPNQ
jgi:hypothetical protein